MCRHDRQPGPASPGIVPVPAGSGENLDPAAALRDLAVRLEAAHTADPSNCPLAEQLRVTLVTIAGSGEQADPLAGLTEFLSTPVPYSPPGV